MISGEKSLDQEEILNFLLREGKLLQSRISAFKHQKPRKSYQKPVEISTQKVNQDQVNKSLNFVYSHQEGKVIDFFIEVEFCWFL